MGEGAKSESFEDGPSGRHGRKPSNAPSVVRLSGGAPTARPTHQVFALQGQLHVDGVAVRKHRRNQPLQMSYGFVVVQEGAQPIVRWFYQLSVDGHALHTGQQSNRGTGSGYGWAWGIDTRASLM
jgi:hypothetical protein